MKEINLADIMGDFSHVVLASEDDNNEILDFCKNIAMKGKGISICYDRSPDYFAFLKEQGSEFFVFKFLNVDLSIGGIATISLRYQIVEGHKQKVAYLCDLRTSLHLYRKARVQWRQCYSQIIKNYRRIRDFGQCSFFYSAVLSDNNQAQTALVQRQRHYAYHEIGGYTAITLLARSPLLFVSKLWERFLYREDFKFRVCHKDDLNRLRTFLYKTNLKKNFGEYISKDYAADDELNRRLKTWNNFDLNSFIIVEDANRDIVATVAPWIQYSSRRLEVIGINLKWKILGKLLRLKRRSPNKKSLQLKILNLTHLEFSDCLEFRTRKAIFIKMLALIEKNSLRANCHFISFLDYPHLNLSKNLGIWRYFYHSSPGRVFQVLSPKEFEDGHYIKSSRKVLGFELGVA